MRFYQSLLSLSPEQILSACSEESNSSFSEFSTKLF